MSCKTLCIIPARSGSKRYPRKNIREFCNKPMITWSIAAAKESAIFEHILEPTNLNAGRIYIAAGFSKNSLFSNDRSAQLSKTQ